MAEKPPTAEEILERLEKLFANRRRMSLYGKGIFPTKYQGQNADVFVTGKDHSPVDSDGKPVTYQGKNILKTFAVTKFNGADEAILLRIANSEKFAAFCDDDSSEGRTTRDIERTGKRKGSNPQIMGDVGYCYKVLLKYRANPASAWQYKAQIWIGGYRAYNLLVKEIQIPLNSYGGSDPEFHINRGSDLIWASLDLRDKKAYVNLCYTVSGVTKLELITVDATQSATAPSPVNAVVGTQQWIINDLVAAARSGLSSGDFSRADSIQLYLHCQGFGVWSTQSASTPVTNSFDYTFNFVIKDGTLTRYIFNQANPILHTYGKQLTTTLAAQPWFSKLSEDFESSLVCENVVNGAQRAVRLGSSTFFSSTLFVSYVFTPTPGNNPLLSGSGLFPNPLSGSYIDPIVNPGTPLPNRGHSIVRVDIDLSVAPRFLSRSPVGSIGSENDATPPYTTPRASDFAFADQFSDVFLKYTSFIDRKSLINRDFSMQTSSLNEIFPENATPPPALTDPSWHNIEHEERDCTVYVYDPNIARQLKELTVKVQPILWGANRTDRSTNLGVLNYLFMNASFG